MSLGLKRENILVTDAKGVVYIGRTEGMDPNKARYARDTSARTLADVIAGADIFLGLSAGGVLEAGDGQGDGARPDHPGDGQPDAGDPAGGRAGGAARRIIGTGRSDYPNQVNNVLCFPFIFRGALDVGATTINEEMKLAAVRAIAELDARRDPRGGGAGLRRARACASAATT